MSKFVNRVIVDQEFEGDRVRMTLRPMGKADALRIAVSGDGGGEGSVGGSRVDAMLEAFAGHLESVEGLTDAAGAAVTKDVMLGSAYFTQLLVAAAVEWAGKSVPSGDSKN